MYKRVILPTDGSDLSLIGVKEGLEAAKSFDVPALAIYVIPPHSVASTTGDYEYEELGQETIEVLSQQFKEKGVRALDRVKKEAEELGVHLETTIREGRPYQEIADVCDDDDIIYMASHGRSGFSSIFIGSTTNRVIKHTDTTVAVVKSKK